MISPPTLPSEKGFELWVKRLRDHISTKAAILSLPTCPPPAQKKKPLTYWTLWWSRGEMRLLWGNFRWMRDQIIEERNWMISHCLSHLLRHICLEILPATWRKLLKLAVNTWRLFVAICRSWFLRYRLPIPNANTRIPWLFNVSAGRSTESCEMPSVITTRFWRKK